MKALIIDHDPLFSQLLKSRLEALNIDVQAVERRDQARDLLQSQHYEMIFIDPSPSNDVRHVLGRMRHAAGRDVYMFLLSEDASAEAAISAGANDVLHKPLDPQGLEVQIDNARRLLTVSKNLRDISEDFPSAGGVIAKSAFNQLFLSAMDRAARYGEHAYVLFIGLRNYQELKDLDGVKAADFSAAKLSQILVNLRRQSDIIGQTRSYEFAFLLQRPERESEPLEAAKRFATSLAEVSGFAMNEAAEVNIHVSLMSLPEGALRADYDITV